MNRKEKLRPCPFCGNEKPVLMTRRGQDGWRDYFYVLCDYNDGGCGASGQWNHYTDLAVEAWNRRKGFTVEEVCKAMILHGQRDPKFKWGETIKYSPSEVAEILSNEMMNES